MNLFDIKIESDRLMQLPIKLEHGEDIFAHFTIEITKYMYPKPADDISETLAWIKSSIKAMEKGKNIQLVIFKKDTGEFMGCTGLHDVEGKTPELGVWTKKSSHGNGYGREAITALFDWACENIKFDDILYPVDKRNIASRKIPESLGGIVVKEYKRKNSAGFELDMAEYRIYKNKI